MEILLIYSAQIQLVGWTIEDLLGGWWGGRALGPSGWSFKHFWRKLSSWRLRPSESGLGFSFTLIVFWRAAQNIPLTCSNEFYISVLQKIFTYSVNELSDKMVPFKIRSKQLEKQTIPSECSELLLLDTSIWYCDWQVQQSHHCTDLSEVEWCTTRCIPII